MSNGGTVNISPEELIRVCDACMDNIKCYNPATDDKVSVYTYWSWHTFSKVEREYRVQPSWSWKGCGVITKLKVLVAIAEGVMADECVESRDIIIPIHQYTNLLYLLNKSDKFEPFIFAGAW